MARTSRETRTNRPAAKRRPATGVGRKGQPRRRRRRVAARRPIITAHLHDALLAGGRAGAGARRAAGPDAARGGARGRRLACRADPSFRRSHRAPQRTRRDRLPPVQRGDGARPCNERYPPADEGAGARQGLCRLCAGASRHVRADVPHRAARHDAAVAARGRRRLVRRAWPNAVGAGRHEQIPASAEALSLDQAAAIARAWSLVHGFTMLLLDGRLKDILHRLPEGTGADQLLDAMLRSTVVRPPAGA